MIRPSRTLSNLMERAESSSTQYLDPATRLLCRLAAAGSGLPERQWVERALRISAARLIPNGFQGKSGPSESLASELGESLPWNCPDALWVPEELLSDECVVSFLECQIQRLQELETLQVAPGVSPDGRHKLFTRAKDSVSNASGALAEKDRWLEELIQSGSEREIPLVSRSMIKSVAALNGRAPHLSGATELVLGELRLQLRGSRRLQFSPILLVGPPGAGKSWWAQELATSLGVSHHFRSLPSVTASFEISGSSSAWSGGKPGFIVRHFMETGCATPLFILDEIDKMTVGNYNPVPCLLGILERSTAARFRDEYFDFPFDISRSLFVATANSVSDLSEPLLERFTVVHVPMPSREQCGTIVDAVWLSLRGERRDLCLPRSLREDVRSCLVGQFHSVRALRRQLIRGLARAARRRGKLQLTRFDLS